MLHNNSLNKGVRIFVATAVLTCPIKWPHLYHLEVDKSSNKPIVGVLVEPIGKNRHKMTQICQISVQIQFKIAKFKTHEIDNEM